MSKENVDKLTFVRQDYSYPVPFDLTNEDKE